MNLDEVRKEIDCIDEQLLELFLRRMELGKEALKEKMYCGKPLVDKRREREILKNISEKSGDMSVYSHRLFNELMTLSRAYQGTVSAGKTQLTKDIENAVLSDAVFPAKASVACQGIEGANSQQAADRLFPQGNIMFCKSFEGVLNAVKSGLCDYGVLPIENSSNGSVHAVYDLLKDGGFNIVRSVKLCVHHELLAQKGTKLCDVKEIMSHEQALGQCGNFIKKLDGMVKISSCANTALAAKIASESPGVAAISSPICAELYDLSRVTDENIQNSENNYTRFVCVSAKPAIYPGANRLSFVASLKHEAGELYKLVSVIDALGVSISKLESKPIVGRDFEFMFLVDLEASVLEPNIIGMLEEIERICGSFVFLGNYQEI
ncbi:MAG: bifunctional chorismate mutase/prephenate dehydratase [Clostridia bacterium]|nr:bifunctional chorismate mutase/prephenate dehydratase [Clostridia bacterium]